MCDSFTFIESFKCKYPGGHIIPRMPKVAKMSKMACTVNFPASLFCYQKGRHYFQLSQLKLHEFKTIKPVYQRMKISRKFDQK